MSIKSVCIDKLDIIVNKYNNKYPRIIKIKPIDVQDNKYIDLDKENNNNNPKSQVDDHERVSKYKDIFTKGYPPNWSEAAFVFKKVKNTISWTYVINDLNGKETFGTFHEKELQKTNHQKFSMKKVIKRKGKKVYVKWKGYDNLFNSWIDKNDVI